MNKIRIITFFASTTVHGPSQDISKGGVTLCQSEGTHQIVTMAKIIIVMAFSPHAVGCLVTKRLAKGGSQAPQATPLTVWLHSNIVQLFTVMVVILVIKFYCFTSVIL